MWCFAEVGHVYSSENVFSHPWLMFYSYKMYLTQAIKKEMIIEYRQSLYWPAVISNHISEKNGKVARWGQRRLKKPITTRMYSLESAEDPNLIFRSLDMSNSKAEMWGKMCNWYCTVLIYTTKSRTIYQHSGIGVLVSRDKPANTSGHKCRLATYCQSENCKPKMHISLDQCLNTVHALVSTNYSSYRYIYITVRLSHFFHTR